MTKELERILAVLHGEYKFDPVVNSIHRQWWFENAYRYFLKYVQYYSQFETEIVDGILL